MEKHESKKYQKPVITDQGPVVNQTKATQCGQLWDGSPVRDDDTRTVEIFQH